MLDVRRSARSLVTFFLAAWAALAAQQVAAQTPPGFVDEVVVPGITSATTIAFLPDGRMLVGDLTEVIWVVQPGASSADATPFLQLDNSQLFGEQGLMDILIDPNFAVNGYYYVFYTKGNPGSANRSRVSRFTASGNSTVAGSEFVLWQDGEDAGAEHHGGSLALGNDGKLYITAGDHSFPQEVQSLSNTKGKVLRINLDGTIPTDNPFYDGAGPNKDEIWALGFRNPFRMSIDPVSGRMYEGDVGENSTTSSIEEVNLVVRGANYGWPLCEGSCATAGMTNPVYQYVHPNHGSAITGGVVYRGSQFPAEFYGTYLFGDYTQRWIKQAFLNADGTVASVANFVPTDGHLDDEALVGDPVKFLVGPDGSLWYVDIGFNDQHQPNPAAIRRVRYTASNSPPVCVAAAAPTTGPAPLSVNFSSAGSFDPEGTALGYSWSFGDGTSSTLPDPSHLYAADGAYTARLTVSDGVNSTLSNDLDIQVGNPPVPQILSPADGSTFRAGDQIAFSGSASDPDEGVLGASSLSWTILLHHEEHFHPALGPLTGAGGVFPIPTSGHDFSGNVSYEIILTATDASGLSTSTSVTVFPEKVNLTFGTQPTGLGLDIDGVRKQTPLVLDSLIDFQHTISAPTQTSGGTAYGFQSWSDGGAQSHVIVTPTSARSYTAQFQVTGNPGLVAAYSFDEGSGTTAADDSGSGNLASLNGATWTPSGKFGSALDFDGTTARVSVADAPALDLTSAMTLMAWVRPSTTRLYWSDVVYKGNDAFYLLGFTPDGPPAVGGTFTVGPLEGTSTLVPGQWAHLAATYDGATLRLYVNGTEVANRAQTGAIATSSFPLEIGGDSIYGQNFPGSIDEVRVYNRALGASEIQSVMAKRVRVGTVTTSPTNGCGIGPELALLVPALMWLRRRARG